MSKLSATMALAPPGPRSLAIVVNKCARSTKRSFMGVKGRVGCVQEQVCLSYRFQAIIANSPPTGLQFGGVSSKFSRGTASEWMLFDLDKLFALFKGIHDLREQWGEPLQKSLATGIPQTNPDDRRAVFFQRCKGNEIGVFANNDRVFLPGPQPDRSIIGIVHSNVYNMFRSLPLTLYQRASAGGSCASIRKRI